MNPEMMKMAMESMSRLTPAQMVEMQRQMASMPPGFIEQQMQAMKGMSPDVLQQQMAAANRMDPAAMENQLKGAAAMARQQEEYQVRSSNQLKEEGNRLFSGHKTAEAIEKYQRAKSNLSGHTSPSATDVRSKCMLNLASCYLRVNNYSACIRECSEVLKIDPENMKALYRRGQGHLALHSHAAAVADLRKALTRAPEQEKPLIQEKLREAEDGFARSDELAEGVTDTELEEVVRQDPETVGTDTAAAAAGAPSGPALPVDSSQMRKARVSGGLPPGAEMSAEAMRNAMDMMAQMDPKDMESMVSMMQASPGGAPGDSGTSSGTAPVMGPDSDQFKQAAAALQANPDLMSQVMKMFGQMDPQQLAAMSEKMSAAGQGGQPSPAALSKMLADPQSAKMMKDVMSKLTPEQLVSMSEAAGQKVTPEQAKVMSEQMRNMSDKQVELLFKGFSWLNRGAGLAQQAKAKLLANKLLALGILLLIVAVSLRYFGLA